MKRNKTVTGYGQAFKKIRQLRGFSQWDVAKIMGNNQTGIHNLEKLHANPTVASLERYANAIGCKLVIQLVPKEN